MGPRIYDPRIRPAGKNGSGKPLSNFQLTKMSFFDKKGYVSIQSCSSKII